jgi:hypothetical protein
MNLLREPILTRSAWTRPADDAGTLIDATPHIIEQDFNRQPFLVRHRLADHKLFDLPQLLKLAQLLPEKSIEYNAGDLPVSIDAGLTPGNGLSVDETLRRIRDCRSWMVLKNVEQDRDYAQLLEQCLNGICLAAGTRITDMHQKEGFIFVSSPGAITPYHIDPEHNFLLQIRGSKVVNIFDPADRQLLPHETLERFHSGFHRNLSLDESHRNRAREFRLESGTGLHFPVTAPHWVRNGDEVSISFSITFRTGESDRRETLYRINSVLRKSGVNPVEPGRTAWRDAVKMGIYNTARGFKHTLQRLQYPANTSDRKVHHNDIFNANT